MMLALGMFVFMRQTLPHQTMQRESDYRWPSNSRMPACRTCAYKSLYH